MNIWSYAFMLFDTEEFSWICSNEAFWEHEWDTHGTCLSTLQPACIPPGSPAGTDVSRLDCRQRMHNLKQFPIRRFIISIGLFPSSRCAIQETNPVRGLMTNPYRRHFLHINGLRMQASLLAPARHILLLKSQAHSKRSPGSRQLSTVQYVIDLANILWSLIRFVE